MEINNLPDEVTVIKMLAGQGKRIDEHSENFNKITRKYKK